MDEVAKLTAGMLKKKLFVMFRQTAKPDELPARLKAHLEWMISAEKRGDIFASGPLMVPGKPPGAGGGLTIMRAQSLDDAQAIARQDPFVEHGIITYEIKEWSVMEGGFSITVHFSDQTYRLD